MSTISILLETIVKISRAKCTLNLKWKRSSKIWKRARTIPIRFKGSTNSLTPIQTTIGKRAWSKRDFNSLSECLQISTNSEKANLKCLREIIRKFKASILPWMIADQDIWVFMIVWTWPGKDKMSSTIQWISRKHSRVRWADSPIRDPVSFSSLSRDWMQINRIVKILWILRSQKWIEIFQISGLKSTKIIEEVWLDVILSLVLTHLQTRWGILQLLLQEQATC